jgi:hypothetical protein
MRKRSGVRNWKVNLRNRNRRSYRRSYQRSERRSERSRKKQRRGCPLTGKGRAQTLSEDSVIIRPNTTDLTERPKLGQRSTPKESIDSLPPTRDKERKKCRRKRPMLRCSEYSSMSHHSLYDMSRHVMSTINLTHEMAEIKEQFARSATIRADARQREKEAEEETVHSQLRLNNPEIALRNVQRDTERRLKRTCSHSEHEAEPAAERQQKEWRNKRHMPPPPDPLETTGPIDDASRHQHRSRAEEPAGETRSLLKMI